MSVTVTLLFMFWKIKLHFKVQYLVEYLKLKNKQKVLLLVGYTFTTKLVNLSFNFVEAKLML